jgi:hypothetical protein
MLDAKEARELELSKKVNEIQSTLDEKVARELELRGMINSVQSALVSKDSQQTELFNFLDYLPVSTPPPQPLYQTSDTFVQQWETTLMTYLGIQVCLIFSKVDGKNKYNVSVRWPLIRWKVLNGRISSSWSSWCTPTFRPCFRVQSIVPIDSEVVKASCNDDVSILKELFLSGKTHPNDTTEDNLTLLYVSSVHRVTI